VLYESKFYPQILSTEASYHIYTSQWPVINVIANFCALCVDKILIFAVLKQWLLQQTETEASFVYIIFAFEMAALCHFEYSAALISVSVRGTILRFFTPQW